ncbi:MAG: PilW family protein [Gammaproteobacteria bacterium]|nr:PilW family protein [Gammaproteobacteria bacterium]
MNVKTFVPKSGFKASQTGMTLIEIMISLLIGAFLLGGVLQIFVNTKQTYRMQEGLSRLQENGRFALEFLTHDIRMAGYLGCISRSATITNTLNDPSNYLYDFTIPVQGSEWDDANSTWDPLEDTSITSPLNGSDIITIRRVNPNGAIVSQHPGGNPPGSADLKLSSNPGLNDCDIVIVSDCEAAAVFQITNFNAANNNNVVHNTGNVCPAPGPGNATQALGKSYEGGELFLAQTISYYIRTNPNNQPALYRRINSEDAQELVEGIEEMHIRYGVDTNGDGTVNQYIRADAVDAAGIWNTVASVRISLLALSIDDNLTAQPVDYTYNGATVTPADRRLRRVFNSTIAVRNRLP